MTLRARMLAAMGGSVVVILVLGAQLVFQYMQTSSTLEAIVSRFAPARTAVVDLNQDIDNMERRLRLYVESGTNGYRVLEEAAVKSAQANMDSLREVLGDRPLFSGPISEMDESLNAWLESVRIPALAAMDSDDPKGAQEIIDSQQAQVTYSDLTAASYRLGTFLTNEVNRVLAEGAHDAQQLAWALAAAIAVALLIPLVSYLVLRHSVLAPIARLRTQMRAAAAAGQHDTVIEPGGPPELRDLGADAEALRRALVHEIDRANAAREALEQESPVVDAIRRELEARTDPQSIGVLVAGVLRPAEGMLAGDFWDRIPLADGRTAAIICDVSGHGPRAGIVAMRLKTAVTLGLISGQDVPQVLHRASDTFADEPGRFATMVVLTADPASGELTWVNAGHPAPRVVRVGGGIEHLEPTGPMVSWLGGAWTTGSTRMGPGDICLAFTDGILESRDSSGAELGDAELDQRLRIAAEGTSEPQEVIAHALAGVRHRANDLGRDDVTMVALRLDPTEGSLIPAPRR